ncbi:MAG: FliO/MopB family protein [Thermodesulfobacteria bacterium]|nr:FliO/MopB family protein [Thermodesulfobacteriota bacterium]
MQWLSYLQALGVVLLILSLFPIGLYIYRRTYLKKTAGSKIKIIEVRPINYKAQILLIEVEGRKYLLGCTDKTVNFLTEVKDASCNSASNDKDRSHTS